MKVSVIVPVYNAENVLHYCVESILNQTYKDFELILVDDGSKDNSGELCDYYAKENENVKVIHIDNGGVSKARNTGIDYANGDFICFVDSDDYLDYSFLENLVRFKLRHKKYDNIWCGFYTGKDYHSTKEKLIVASNKEEFSLFDRSEVMSLHEMWLSQMPWNKIYERRIIIDNRIKFSEDLSLGEDLLFNLDYLNSTNGKILIINNPLYFYVHGEKESLDNKFYYNLNEIYNRINKSLYEHMKIWESSEKQFTIYYNTSFYSYEKVFRNTFHKNSTIKNKYVYNKAIMKSERFKHALNYSDCYINPLYRMGYKYCSYRLIRFLDKVSSFIN